MTESASKPISTIGPFTITEGEDAFGKFLVVSEFGSAWPIHLLQPMNQQAEKHYTPDVGVRALMALLLLAYDLGKRDQRREIRQALGFTGAPGEFINGR